MRRRNSRIALLAGSLVVGVSAAATTIPPPVWAANCSGFNVDFAGITKFVPAGGRMYGSQAIIELYDHDVCSTGTGGFSADWVAVVRPTNANNIIQIGYDDCTINACIPGVPSNQPYYFWAHGHMAGACGTELPPIVQDLGDAAGATHTFTVEHIDLPTLDQYVVKLDGVQKNGIGDPTACWGGVPTRADIFSEVGDDASQQGGDAADKQGFTESRYKDASYWRQWDRALNSPCSVNDRLATTTVCNTSSYSTDHHYISDDRYP